MERASSATGRAREPSGTCSRSKPLRDLGHDGSITRGARNLPANWESSRFNLPRLIREAVPKIGDHECMVVMHNDAVVQGLSEMPYVQSRANWGVLTIGTGLGNASFANRKPA